MEGTEGLTKEQIAAAEEVTRELLREDDPWNVLATRTYIASSARKLVDQFQSQRPLVSYFRGKKK